MKRGQAGRRRNRLWLWNLTLPERSATLAAERADEVRTEQVRVAATRTAERAEETRVEQERTAITLAAERANRLRIEQEKTAAADEVLSSSNALVTAQ
jgi:hypothetical protein